MARVFHRLRVIGLLGPCSLTFFLILWTIDAFGTRQYLDLQQSFAFRAMNVLSNGLTSDANFVESGTVVCCGSMQTQCNSGTHSNNLCSPSNTDLLGRSNQSRIGQHAVCLPCINTIVNLGQIYVLLHVAQISSAGVQQILHGSQMQYACWM